MNQLRPCLVLCALLLFACCVVYPAFVTVVAQACFPVEANGSLVMIDGQVRGSMLLGQPFEKPEAHAEYFWARASAASVDEGSHVLVSGGSNYGPLNAALEAEVRARVDALRASGVKGDVPADLVTKSGSGFDPDLSPAAAELQIPRIARARDLPEVEIRQLVASRVRGSTFGLLGEPRVNVLELNLALDARKSASR